MAELSNYIGIVAGVCTSSSLIPQLVKMIREKKGDQVSIWMLLVLLTGLGLWVWYGILRDDMPILLTNCFAILVNFSLIVLRIIYRDRK